MTRPNVLLITVDQWPGPLLGIAGHPVIRTPTLDELARAGTLYPNAYSDCPVCIPARRSLMLGQSPRAHGDRVYDDALPMPRQTLARSFADAGYQCQAVGKLHVWPQRDRIGFDDVLLDEEGRAQYGVMDDYEIFLGDQGHPGQQFDHGMSTDGYVHRPWHLPERLHVTNWATLAMIRQIKRRDPTRPGFWYLSYRHPHPPLVPLPCYLDMYRGDIDAPLAGNWGDVPWAIGSRRVRGEKYSPNDVADIRRAFYALCTQIDHQIRLVIGTLREEQLLADTIILFASDHGDMLGDHGLWAKSTMYRGSVTVPMILVRPPGTALTGVVDPRPVLLSDVMPTLLSLAGIPVPDTCTGVSMTQAPRTSAYAECGSGDGASRMLVQDGFKLIWYPCGNRRHLFDLSTDPGETCDLSADPARAAVLDRLTEGLIAHLYGGDLDWLADGRLAGTPDRPVEPRVNRDLSSQRGHHWPPQLHSDMPQLLNSA